MKLKKIRRFTPALLAVGVFLGRGAHADTTINFDCTPVPSKGDPLSDCIPPQINNPNAPPGITNYGNYAAASSPGIAVSGFGTPNIGITWNSDNFPDTRWEYYNTTFAPWGNVPGGSGVVQLQGCSAGTAELLTFAPNNPGASVEIESFNFFPYYDAVADVNVYGGLERYTFNISVLSGKTVVSGPTMITFTSDGTENHPVAINYSGTPGQTLKLKLARVKSTLGAGEIEGTAYSLAVDKIAFAQTPTTAFPAGPQVVSVSPADGTGGLPATSSPAYSAIISNGPTLSVANPIQLKLDGSPVSPPPTVTSLGSGQTSVTYPGAATLLASGAHVYTLVYADNLNGFYTNEVVFSTPYTTLPESYALPSGSGITRGLTYRTVSADTQVTNSLDSSISRAVAQLNGTLINPATGLPFTNSATLGPNPDGSYNVDTINFDGNGNNAGDFPNDVGFPGLPALVDWFSTEALLFLDLQPGYYRMGVNSDDGFEVNALPPEGVPGSPLVLGLFDGGRGAADTLFDLLVTKSGVYPFQVIYFQSDTSADEEFFSVTNITTGDKVLINDPAVGNAIKSYRVLVPHLTRIVPSGANVVLNWAYGTPPFQVQMKTNITDAVWNNVGGTTSSRTATVPALPDTGFYRVFGQ